MEISKKELANKDKIRISERQQDIRLKCLELIVRFGPDTYKNGNNMYNVANTMYAYITTGDQLSKIV